MTSSSPYPVGPSVPTTPTNPKPSPQLDPYKSSNLSETAFTPNQSPHRHFSFPLPFGFSLTKSVLILLTIFFLSLIFGVLIVNVFG